MRPFLLLALFATTAASAAIAPKKDDLSAIRAAGVLKVATTGEDSPPFLYRDAAGKRVGVDVEIAEAMAEKLGVKLEWVTGPQISFKEVFESVRAGKADVALAALFPTLDRVADARFTEPYLRIRQILFVQRLRATALKLPTDFDGLVARPGLVYGYFPDAGTADGLLRRELAATWKPYDRVERGVEPRTRMLADFVKGELTAVWIDEIELEKWRRINPSLDLYGFPVEVPAGDLPIAIATRRDRPELLEWTNLFLAQLRRGDALNRLYQRHKAASGKSVL